MYSASQRADDGSISALARDGTFRGMERDQAMPTSDRVAAVATAVKDQNEAKLEALRAAIDEGDASGIAEGDVFEWVREALKLHGNPG